MKVNFVLLERPASPDDPFFLDGQIQLFVLEQIGIVELPLSFRALTVHNFPSVFLGDRGDVLGDTGSSVVGLGFGQGDGLHEVEIIEKAYPDDAGEDVQPADDSQFHVILP